MYITDPYRMAGTVALQGEGRGPLPVHKCRRLQGQKATMAKDSWVPVLLHQHSWFGRTRVSQGRHLLCGVISNTESGQKQQCFLRNIGGAQPFFPVNCV